MRSLIGAPCAESPQPDNETAGQSGCLRSLRGRGGGPGDRPGRHPRSPPVRTAGQRRTDRHHRRAMSSMTRPPPASSPDHEHPGVRRAVRARSARRQVTCPVHDRRPSFHLHAWRSGRRGSLFSRRSSANADEADGGDDDVSAAVCHRARMTRRWPLAAARQGPRSSGSPGAKLEAVGRAIEHAECGSTGPARCGGSKRILATAASLGSDIRTESELRIHMTRQLPRWHERWAGGRRQLVPMTPPVGGRFTPDVV
jgi:hypothetical protein